MWTGEFDLSKLSVEGEILKRERKSYEYPDMCERGLDCMPVNWLRALTIINNNI